MQTKQVSIEFISTLPVDKQKEFLENEFKSIHSYSITAPSDKNKRWSTYVHTANNNRVKIAKTNFIDFYNKLYSFYDPNNHITLSQYFVEWLYFRKGSVKNATLLRNIQHWKRYYINSPLASMPLVDITTEIIEDFHKDLVSKYEMSRKEYGNAFGIIRGIFRLAIKNDIVVKNPCDYVNTNRFRFVYKVRPEPNKMILQKNEELLVTEAIKRQLTNTENDLVLLGILFLLHSGLRNGELVALKFSDFTINSEKQYFTVQRMEVVVPEIDIDTLSLLSEKYVLEDNTKTNNAAGNRTIYLTEYALDIYNSIVQIHNQYNLLDDEFLFTSSNGRLHTKHIAQKLRSICAELNIELYSPHDLRRSTASKLFQNLVPLPELSRMLGHTNSNTTFGYVHAYLPNEELKKLYDDIM